MKKFIALFLVISFLGMNCATYEKGKGINLGPGQKPGVKLVIQKTDGQELQGELITVKKDSFLLKDTGSGADVSVDIKDIRVIKIVRESKTLGGIGLGLFVGVGVGAMVGIVVDEAIGKADCIWGPEHSALLGGTIGALLGGTIGGLVGGVSGGIIRANRISKTIQIEGKPEAEINKIFEDLRKKARVPDFQ